jgi:hypothetical protein
MYGENTITLPLAGGVELGGARNQYFYSHPSFPSKGEGGKPDDLLRHSRESGNPVGLNRMHFCLAGLLHFVRNDGILDFRHYNKVSAASEAWQRRSRSGNPGNLVIARRRSRRGNPEIQTAGLLHFVRNDGILDFRHCNKASAASGARQRLSRGGNPEHIVITRRRSRRGNPEIQTAGLLHFVRNDGILDFRHCNKVSTAGGARQRLSRSGNPGHFVIARRRSRRGNPEIQTAGLLHFVRNDGTLSRWTSFAMTARVS